MGPLAFYRLLLLLTYVGFASFYILRRFNKSHILWGIIWGIFS